MSAKGRSLSMPGRNPAKLSIRPEERKHKTTIVSKFLSTEEQILPAGLLRKLLNIAEIEENHGHAPSVIK